jgi:hypothetical protein
MWSRGCVRLVFNSERKRGTGAVERRWNINGQSGLTQNEFWQSLEKDSAAKKTQKRHQPS